MADFDQEAYLFFENPISLDAQEYNLFKNDLSKDLSRLNANFTCKVKTARTNIYGYISEGMDNEKLSSIIQLEGISNKQLFYLEVKWRA